MGSNADTLQHFSPVYDDGSMEESNMNHVDIGIACRGASWEVCGDTAVVV